MIFLILVIDIYYLVYQIFNVNRFLSVKAIVILLQNFEQFHVNAPFLYPLETSENQRFD